MKKKETVVVRSYENKTENEAFLITFIHSKENFLSRKQINSYSSHGDFKGPAHLFVVHALGIPRQLGMEEWAVN